MKKLISLLLIAMMCISLCACGGTESSGGEDKETEILSMDMTEEQLKKYYDTTKFTGTPRIGKIKVYKVDKENNTATYTCGEIDTTLTKQTMEYVEGFNEGYFYRCILVDNNTPDNVGDDAVAYVFLKWFD